MKMESLSNPIVELNVGGVLYTTSLATLTSSHESESRLLKMFASLGGNGSSDNPAADGNGTDHPGDVVRLRDSKGRHFIDRDGTLFRFILDYLRTGELILPSGFREKSRLLQEAEYFNLTKLRDSLQKPPLSPLCDDTTTLRDHSSSTTTSSSTTSVKSSSSPILAQPPLPPIKPSTETQPPDVTTAGTQGGAGGTGGGEGGGDKLVTAAYITVGYRGTFAFGRSGQTDVKFRKLSKIYVSGRIAVCRQVFQETLNESRDPDRGSSARYSSRFYLKHTALEMAFDMLHEAGFKMVGSAGSGTNSSGGADAMPYADVEERRWNHYNEFVFCRP